MRLRSRSEVEAFLKAGDGPAFVVVAHAGGAPSWRRLYGVGASFGTADTTGYVAVEDRDAVVALVSGLMLREVLTFDAADTVEQCTIFFDVLPPIIGDVTTAQNLLRNRVPLAFLNHWSYNAHVAMAHDDREALYQIELPKFRATALDHHESLVQYGLRVAYEVELHAAMLLARAGAKGYRRDAEQVYPTWHTLHESGAGNITAVAPPLVSTKALDRRAYVADEGHRWVQIEWPFLDIEVLAGRSGDPWLTALAKEPDPYQGLMDLWQTPRDSARSILQHIIATGPNVVAYRAKGGAEQRLLDLMACCPDWVHWAAELKKQAEADGCLVSYLGRLVKVDAPRKAHAADIQVTQSMLLKMLIARLHVEADLDPRVWTGLHAFLPVYSKLAYQLDVHVPLSDHVPAALRVGALRVTSLPLRVVVSMGPSWGQLMPVTSSLLSQAEQDLLSPASYFLLCPLCDKVAQDEATLRQHVQETHPEVADLDHFVERSKTELSRAED